MLTVVVNVGYTIQTQAQTPSHYDLAPFRRKLIHPYVSLMGRFHERYRIVRNAKHGTTERQYMKT